MTSWTPMVILPNVKLIGAIEAGHAAFAPATDPRVRDIIAEHPNFAVFLDRFFDEFNEKRCSTILLLSLSAPDECSSSDALASIRDILSAAIIPRARARHIQQGFGLGIRYSSAFDFYPWMVGRDYQSIVSLTPELHGFHVVDNFKGQTYPGIPHYVLSRGSLDKPLYDALLDRWVSAYSGKSPSWVEAKVMRSLNMAYHACQSPGGQETSIFDFGRTIALWVSALEILSYPEKKGKSNQQRVENILKKSRWIDSHCRTSSHNLCGRLYRQRHDFLHGNRIVRNPLTQSETLSLFRIAAPLYRMVLATFLGLEHEAVDADLEDSILLGKQLAEKMEFDGYQEAYEAAIRVVHSTIASMQH